MNKASVLRYIVGNGHILIETLMGARSVVVLRKFDQDALQMLSIDDENRIQAFFPDSANPPFGVSICIGSLKRSVNDMDAYGSKTAAKALLKEPSLSWIKNCKHLPLSCISQTNCLAC